MAMAFPVGTLRHEKLRDVHTPHWLGELEAAVCSEDEAASEIATHKDDASAHHIKTTNFNELNGRWTLAQAYRGADGKIMVFKGPGNNPVEEDKPTGGLTFTELSGSQYTTPTANSTWEDWDLSGIIGEGAKYALFGVYGFGTYGSVQVGIRKSGSTVPRYQWRQSYAKPADVVINNTVAMISGVDENRVVEIWAYGNWNGIRIQIFGYWS